LLILLLCALPGGVTAPAAALTRGQQACVDGLSRGLGAVDLQVARQIGSCLQNHAKGRSFDAKDPEIDTLEECAAADPRGRIARALERAQAQFERLCTPPPAGKLEDPFPEFGATDAARASGLALGLAPDLARDLFGPDLDLSLSTDPAAAKCQQAAWKTATRCHQARTAAFRSCQKRTLRGGGGGLPAASRDELREACLGVGAEAQPDPHGKLASRCSETGAGIAKACGGQDLDALLPGCAGETDTAACLERQGACRACLQLSAAGDLRRSCDLFDDGEANGSCGDTSIRCESPADGAMIVAAPGAEIELAGQVPDTSQIEGVAVDGVPVTLDEEGFFSHPVTAEFGVHFLEVAALGETGAEARRICTFLAAESFAAEDDFLGDGLSLTLAQAAVDDGSRGGDLNSLGDILHAVVNSPGLRNQLHASLLATNPLKPSSCHREVCVPIFGCSCVLSSQITYTGSSIAGPNTVALDLVPGGLHTAATARNLSMSLRVTGAVSNVPYDVSGTVSSASLGASLTSDVTAQDGAFSATVRPNSISTSVGTIGVVIDGVPQAITDVVVSVVQGAIRSLILNVLRDYASSQLGPLLADLLAGLGALATDVDVPRLAGPGSIALSLETAASSASTTNARTLLGLAVRADAAAEHDIPSLGAALPSGPVLGEPGVATPLAFAGHLGAMNQILHALWRGGLLHGHVDESVLPELGPGVEAELEALLPPVVSTDGDTGLVQLGALRVTLTYPGLFDTPVLLSAGAEATLTLAAEGDSLLLESLAPVAVRVSGVDTALTPGDQAIVDVVATVILQRLLESALAAAAEGLPILAFELPASVGPYGLPAGSKLGVVNPMLELTPTHLLLKGGLGTLGP